MIYYRKRREGCAWKWTDMYTYTVHCIATAWSQVDVRVMCMCVLNCIHIELHWRCRCVVHASQYYVICSFRRKNKCHIHDISLHVVWHTDCAVSVRLSCHCPETIMNEAIEWNECKVMVTTRRSAQCHQCELLCTWHISDVTMVTTYTHVTMSLTATHSAQWPVVRLVFLHGFYFSCCLWHPTTEWKKTSNSSSKHN